MLGYRFSNSSALSALQYSGGTVHIRASKNDQFGDGSTRYIGPSTLAAVGRYLAASGHTSGPLFRRLLPRRSAPTASGRSCVSGLPR